MRATRIPALLGVILGLLLVTPGATAHTVPASARPLMLHLKWHQVATGVSSVSSDGRYVQFGTPSSTTVLDEQTGRKMTVAAPTGCAIYNFQFGPPFLPGTGGPWLLAGCGEMDRQPPFQLYNLVTSVWLTLTPPQPGDFPQAVGADWVEWQAPPPQSCVQTDHCDEPPPVFQSLRTGEVLQAPARWLAGGDVVPDLGLPTLARKLCSPERLLSDGDPDGPGPDPVTLEGRLAVVSQGSGFTGYPTRTYIERCGSRRRVEVRDQLLVNSHAVVSTIFVNGLERRFAGVFLPTLKRFTFALPYAINPYLTDLVLSEHHLYLLKKSGTVIATDSPSAP